MNHPLKTIFNLIAKKDTAIDPREILKNFKYFKTYNLIPLIAYHIEKKSIRINSTGIEQQLCSSREFDIFRRKYLKNELKNLLKILSEEDLILFKGSIQLINPYWNNYDGYLPMDIDLIFKRTKKERVIKSVSQYYSIISENYNRTVIQTKDKMATFDLHFFPLNNISENLIIKHLMLSCKRYNFNGFKILLPSFTMSLVYRLYHTFYHHNDFLPIHPLDIIDIYYLLIKSLENEELSNILNKIEEFHLMHTFVPIYNFFKRKLKLNLPNKSLKRVPVKLYSLLFNKNFFPDFIYYAFARNVLFKLEKLGPTSYTNFYKLIQYHLYPEIRCNYNKISQRIFHLIKALLLSILSEIFFPTISKIVRAKNRY